MSSDRNKNETTLNTFNEQVAQQGNANVGRVVTGANSTGDVKINITDGSDVALYGMRDVATFAVNASHQSVMKTLDALQSHQRQADETVSEAVAAAQQTALNATPVQPDLVSAMSDTQKKYLMAAVAVAVVVAVIVIARK